MGIVEAQENFKREVASINSCVADNVEKGMSLTEVQETVKKCADGG